MSSHLRFIWISDFCRTSRFSVGDWNGIRRLAPPLARLARVGFLRAFSLLFGQVSFSFSLDGFS